MAWTTPNTYIVGEQVTAAGLNIDQRDNLAQLSVHSHNSDGAGDGSATLGNLAQTIYTDGSAPSAPGSGITAIYTVSGRPFYRAHGGASTQLLINSDLHAQDHDTAHEPGGVDTMAVDQGAGVGSLRTLGTNATQIAAGNHTH